MTKYPKILLTGGTGQIGHELTETLRPFGKIWTPNRGELDLANLKSLRSKIVSYMPDIIINAAAYTDVDAAEIHKDLARVINADAPQIMAEEACRLGIPIIHFSTDYVFDGKKESPYFEQDRTNPVNVYGETKLLAENLIKATHKQNLIIRTSWVYSKTRGRNFYRTMKRFFHEREEVSVVADQFGNPTEAIFIAEKTAKMIAELKKTSEETRWGTYHLTGNETLSWYGFAEKILREDIKRSSANKINCIKPIKYEDYKSPADRPKYSVFSNQKIYKNFPTLID